MHGTIEHEANKGERNSERRRAAVCECATRSNEESSSYRAAYRNHLKMTAFERPCQWRGGGSLRGGLDVEDSAIGAHDARRCRMRVWVFSEAVDDARLP